MIDKMFEIGLLYDFYAELLTPHQKRISQLYFEDNYTLTEIADVTGVSRQAVHDAVSKSEKSLRGYEEKLGLAKRFLERENEIRRAYEALDAIIEDHPGDEALIAELRSIRDIFDRLGEE